MKPDACAIKGCDATAVGCDANGASVWGEPPKDHARHLTLPELVRSIITMAEREFSVTVGMGHVAPGEFLDLGQAVVEGLTAYGLQIIPKTRTTFAVRTTRTEGPHVDLVLFAGPGEGQRARCGELTLRQEEARDLEARLA
jgi:hypothetical protein